MSTHLEGRVFDQRYQLLRRIAEGGMAEVYQALDLRLDKEVAVKVLHARLRDEPGIAHRFSREAQTAAQLNHPHVVNVSDQGIDEETGLPYLVMEFIAGTTLRTVINQRGKLSPKVAMTFISAIVNGLAASHRLGLVHRDMKPENVLVASSGTIKVTDFGLTRPSTQHTSVNILVGTAAYISPELVTGRQADERSDIYSVGIMLYELLTGQQPYRGDSLQVAYAHAHQRVPNPQQIEADIPDAVAQLVLDCTEPDPQQRPHNAMVLAERISVLRRGLLNVEAAEAQATEVLSEVEADNVPTEAFTPLYPAPARPTRNGQDATMALAAVPDDGVELYAEAPAEHFHDAAEEASPRATPRVSRSQAKRPQVILRQLDLSYLAISTLLWCAAIAAAGIVGYFVTQQLLP